MKIFVSWSGEVSCKIAEVLKRWVPCILQSVEVFFSPEDIEKGENWDKILSQELEECRYGIVCLTPENINAPWINFEAGAIAKTLNPRVTALMINIKPSDIKGPLSRYQATKIEKQDFYQLIEAINKGLDNPLDEKILKNTFDALWDCLKEDIDKTISECVEVVADVNTENDKQEMNSAPVEEILQLLRYQNSLLNSPDKLLPIEYLDKIRRTFESGNEEIYSKKRIIGIIEELIRYCEKIMKDVQNVDIEMRKIIFEIVHFEEMLFILRRYGQRISPLLYREISFLEKEYQKNKIYINNKISDQIELFKLEEIDE